MLEEAAIVDRIFRDYEGRISHEKSRRQLN